MRHRSVREVGAGTALKGSSLHMLGYCREREIFAHKVVLAAVSPALFDMFLRENEEEGTRDILSMG